MTSLFTLENAPRDEALLVQMSRAILYRIAMRLHLFTGQPNEEETIRSFMSKDIQVMAATILEGLLEYDRNPQAVQARAMLAPGARAASAAAATPGAQPQMTQNYAPPPGYGAPPQQNLPYGAPPGGGAPPGYGAPPGPPQGGPPAPPQGGWQQPPPGAAPPQAHPGYGAPPGGPPPGYGAPPGAAPPPGYGAPPGPPPGTGAPPGYGAPPQAGPPPGYGAPPGGPPPGYGAPPPGAAPANAWQPQPGGPPPGYGAPPGAPPQQQPPQAAPPGYPPQAAPPGAPPGSQRQPQTQSDPNNQGSSVGGQLLAAISGLTQEMQTFNQLIRGLATLGESQFIATVAIAQHVGIPHESLVQRMAAERETVRAQFLKPGN